MFDEKKIIEDILSGDQKAFEVLLIQYQKLIRHLVFGLVRNNEDVADLQQEIFVKIHQRLPSFQQKSKLSTWIGTITYNHCINYLRKERKLVDIDSFPEQKEQFYEEADNDELSDNNQMLIVLHKAIDNLPDQHRLILTLFHIDNLHYDEISEILKLPEGTIKSRLFRARKILKNTLIKTKKT